MSIKYINDGAGNSIDAATVIQVYAHEQRIATNPFLALRAHPQEAIPMGDGGHYIFHNVLGLDLPEREAAKPTNSSYDYTDGASTIKVELTVSAPFKTAAYSFTDSDVIQMGGIDFAKFTSRQVADALIKAEINEEANKILTNTDVRSIDSSAATTALDKFIALKSVVTDYFAINETEEN
ncbi:hypothetical protein [Mycobacterium sp.]|uniref:hypothetical protein n=1 Tax=Mycobacterium sp. TaxID=1785 RepID=UPI003A85909A